jgi:hypothetical protein
MTTHTVNAHGVDPATVTQAHADRVAAALGLAGAERIGCGGFLIGCRTGWLTITAEPHSADCIKVPWSLVAGLGDPWQPIETAPLRDAVLVYHKAHWAALGCKLEDGTWWRWREPVGNEPLNFTPTHWAPWPAIRDSRTPKEAGHG